MTEWLAAQAWSDGSTGMLGLSYMGHTQFEAASARPPHLKPIYPQVAYFDFYYWPYPGGIFESAWLRIWQDTVKELDNSGEAVAEDADGSMLAAATKDHQANPDWFQVYSAMPYRDSRDPQTGVQSYEVPELHTFLKGIIDSQIPVYHRGGWYDILKDLQAEFGLTYLFIAHNLSVVEHVSNRVAVMYLGKMVELATREDLFAKPLHPYTMALMSAIPVPNPRLKRQRTILKGDVPSPLNPPKGCRFHPRCPVALEICSQEEPQFKMVGPEHYAACWLVE